MGFVVSMKNVGKPVSEGTYDVALTKVVANKNQKGEDQLILTANIDDSSSSWHGRPLTRRFVISNDPEKDNSGVIFYMNQALIAFGADEDDLDADEVDVVEVATSLIGNKAVAEVKHTENPKDPEKPYVNANFSPSGL